MVVIIYGRLEDSALAQASLGVRARFDCLLENRVRGSIPTILEISMAGIADVITSGQREGAVVVFEVVGMGHLFNEDGHESNGMGGRAGTSFMGTDRVRNVVLEVGARDISAIPARGKQDLDANAVGVSALWERKRLRDGRLVVAEAMVVEGLVRWIRGHRASGGGTGDHAETLGELLNDLFGAAMQVVDGPVDRYELELAGVPMLVVESWSPVV